jgi:hypothetical protein
MVAIKKESQFLPPSCPIFVRTPPVSDHGADRYRNSTFIPLIAAGIFFASNGKTHVAFIDALFLCVSAMTVTGLATIDLSSVTPWQQVILFILMCLGSPVTVSWVMVLVRRYFFAQKFEHVLDPQLSSADPPIVAVSDAQRTNKLSRILPWAKAKFLQSRQPDSSQVQSYGQSPGTKKGGLHHDMIRRVEFARQWVDPSALVESPEKDLHLTSLYRTNSAPVLRFAAVESVISHFPSCPQSDHRCTCRRVLRWMGLIPLGLDVRTLMNLHTILYGHRLLNSFDMDLTDKCTGLLLMTNIHTGSCRMAPLAKHHFRLCVTREAR